VYINSVCGSVSVTWYLWEHSIILFQKGFPYDGVVIKRLDEIESSYLLLVKMYVSL
jgi:hypothetical protein